MPEQRMRGICHFSTQLDATHGNVLWDIRKRGPDRISAPEALSFGEKIAKIGPVDSEIIVLRAIIKKIIKNMYIPSGKFAERAKLKKKL